MLCNCLNDVAQPHAHVGDFFESLKRPNYTLPLKTFTKRTPAERVYCGE